MGYWMPCARPWGETETAHGFLHKDHEGHKDHKDHKDKTKQEEHEIRRTSCLWYIVTPELLSLLFDFFVVFVIFVIFVIFVKKTVSACSEYGDD